MRRHLTSTDNTKTSEQQPAASSPPPLAESKREFVLPPYLQPGSGITIEEYSKAENGDPKAMYDVGSVIKMAEPASDAEYKKAMQDKDNQWYANRNELAFKWYERAAKAGCFEAQRELGAAYETGCGVDSSFDEARKWYKAAYVTAKKNKDEVGMEGATADLEGLKDDIANDKRAQKEMARTGQSVGQCSQKYYIVNQPKNNCI